MFRECKEKMRAAAVSGLNVWELGYWSTDVEEDNDTSGGENQDEDYYDEEDEATGDDLTSKIEQEKLDKSLKPEEKQYLEGVSDIEKKILIQNDNFAKKKKNKYAEEEFKWWHFDDKETYFVLTTKRKNTYKSGD